MPTSFQSNENSNRELGHDCTSEPDLTFSLPKLKGFKIAFVNIASLPKYLAFDTIEWTFVEKTLHHFGFGSSLINWINLFPSDIQSCVINTGFSAGFFELSRGVRQRCPLSPYIFILCAEVLANTIALSTPSVKIMKLKESQ